MAMVFRAAMERVVNNAYAAPKSMRQRIHDILNTQIASPAVPGNRFSKPSISDSSQIALKAAKPKWVEKPMVGKVGRGMGTLIILREEEPAHKQLAALSHEAIVAMEWLPTSHTDIGPFRGLLTFREEGDTSHANARVKAWGVPHALWPGVNEQLAALEGKVVFFEVTKDSVMLREATADEHAAATPTPARKTVELPLIDSSSYSFYLTASESGIPGPNLAGHKISLVNDLRAASLTTSDPQIDVSIVDGSVLPFGALANLLEFNRKRTQFDSLIQIATRAAAKHNRPTVTRALVQLRMLIVGLRFVYSAVWTEMQHDHDIRFHLFSHESRSSGYFVRASVSAENLPDYPGVGSGLYKTVPHVRHTTNALLQASLEVMAATWSDEAFWDRRAYGMDETRVWPAVWLVPSQPADYSFTINTSRAAAGKPEQLLIEIVQGLGESLVGSDQKFRGVPTKIIYDKSTQQVILREPGHKQFQVVLKNMRGLEGGTLVVPTDEASEFLRHPDAQRLIQALIQVGQQTEAFFQRPQEIEGALIADPERPGHWTITLLQTRYLEPPPPSTPNGGSSPGSPPSPSLPITPPPMLPIPHDLDGPTNMGPTLHSLDQNAGAA